MEERVLRAPAWLTGSHRGHGLLSTAPRFILSRPAPLINTGLHELCQVRPALPSDRGSRGGGQGGSAGAAAPAASHGLIARSSSSRGGGSWGGTPGLCCPPPDIPVHLFGMGCQLLPFFLMHRTRLEGTAKWTSVLCCAALYHSSGAQIVSPQ